MLTPLFLVVFGVALALPGGRPRDPGKVGQLATGSRRDIGACAGWRPSHRTPQPWGTTKDSQLRVVRGGRLRAHRQSATLSNSLVSKKWNSCTRRSAPDCIRD